MTLCKAFALGFWHFRQRCLTNMKKKQSWRIGSVMMWIVQHPVHHHCEGQLLSLLMRTCTRSHQGFFMPKLKRCNPTHTLLFFFSKWFSKFWTFFSFWWSFEVLLSVFLSHLIGCRREDCVSFLVACCQLALLEAHHRRVNANVYISEIEK